jgi:rSAM/selenodomain-associated transferase 1
MKRALALFAKNPTATLVKTRLVPPLTYAEAARLAGAFLLDSSSAIATIARLLDAKACTFVDPPSATGAIKPLLPKNVAIYAQAPGDLADRLKAALMILLNEGFQAVCFVGTDSPTLPHAYVARAFAALDSGHELALGPASDGGYYLIGLRGAHLEVFEDIDWSTERVFAQTQARAQRLGLSVAVLPQWYDVDDAPSLERLRRDPCVASAPHTAAVLASLFAPDRTR